MDSIEFNWIGWKCEGNSDKVWGTFYPVSSDGRRTYYSFWGRRGKSVSFKQGLSGWEADTKQREKEREGYREMNQAEMLKIWPDFEEKLSKRFCFCLLANKIK